MKTICPFLSLFFIGLCSCLCAQNTSSQFDPSIFDGDLAKLASLASNKDAFEDTATSIMENVQKAMAGEKVKKTPRADLLHFASKIQNASNQAPVCYSWTYMRVMSVRALIYSLATNAPKERTPEFWLSLNAAVRIVDSLATDFIALGGEKAAISYSGNWKSAGGITLTDAYKDKIRNANAALCLSTNLPALKKLVAIQCGATNPSGNLDTLADSLKKEKFLPPQITWILNELKH